MNQNRVPGILLIVIFLLGAAASPGHALGRKPGEPAPETVPSATRTVAALPGVESATGVIMAATPSGVAGAVRASTGGVGEATGVRSATPGGMFSEAVAGAPADVTKATEEKKYKFNFNNQDVNKILEWLMQEKKKPVIAKDVSGQFTLRNPREVTFKEAYRLVEEILNSMGYTIVEDDLLIWVVKISEARARLPETIDGLENVPAGLETYRVVVPLKYASVSDLKDKISPLVPGGEVVVDENSQSLVIVGAGDHLRRLATVIKYLDVPKEDALTQRDVVPLQYIEADRAQEILRTLIGDSIPGARPRNEMQVPLRIASSEFTNSILISGSIRDVSRIKEFVKRIDTPQADKVQIYMKKLEFAQAAGVAETVNTVIKGRKDMPNPPVVVGNEWTNSLVVSGRAADASWVFDFVSQIDVPKTLEERTEVIQVEHLDVTIMSGYVRGVLMQGPRVSYEEYSPWRSERRYSDSQQSQMRIMEDLQKNSLIVTGKQEQIDQVRELVRQLDIASEMETEGPKIHYLERADATEVAEKVNELFGLVQGTQFRGDFYDRGRYMSGGFQPPSRGRDASPSEEVNAIAIPSINAVAIFANTMKAHNSAEEMIRKLDQETPELGSTLVIPLQNATATEMALLIEDLFQQGGENRDFFWFLAGGAESERLISNLIGKVRISPEPRTNSIIAITSKQNHNAILNLVHSLDRDTAQVLIEVLLLEVVLDDKFDLGIEWGRLDSSGDPGSLTIGSSARGIPGDNIGDNPVSGNFSSLFTDSLSNWQWAIMTQAQFDVSLHFLKKSGDSKVISRPVLMTWDNKGARFINGNRVPQVSELRETQGGDLLPAFDYIDVGLILDVTPHINHQNKVDLSLKLDLDDLTDQQVLGVPIFRRRNVTTNISVQDGNTVVLAGIIQNTVQQTTSKVPLLGDIPVLGAPFRRKRNVKQNTELIAFLTPHVVRGATDQASIMEIQRRRLESEQNSLDFEPNAYPDYKGSIQEYDTMPLESAQRAREATESLKLNNTPAAPQEEIRDGDRAPAPRERPERPPRRRRDRQVSEAEAGGNGY